FQAEDGIRDWSVTGVQTCALPISPPRLAGNSSLLAQEFHFGILLPRFDPWQLIALKTFGTSPWRDIGRRARPRLPTPCSTLPERSEERRVGKEGRSRWVAE